VILQPPFSPAEQLVKTLQSQSFAVAAPQAVADYSHIALSDLVHLKQYWHDLPRDPYLKDGGRYRFRRHDSYRIHQGSFELMPHRAHWQSLNYNALHGGIHRWFEPILSGLSRDPVWQKLLCATAKILSQAKPVSTWFVEAHQFRIDTADGIGRPTPEGAHRDGVDYVAVFLVDRHDIKGGETRIFEAQGSAGQRFTLTDSWSLLLLDDERMIHESTPIQPLHPGGYRDTLVLTFRAHGFQEQVGQEQ